jgi:hypothetical protein
VIEALKTDHIKIVLFILRIMDKEESYIQSDAFTPYPFVWQPKPTLAKGGSKGQAASL